MADIPKDEIETIIEQLGAFLREAVADGSKVEVTTITGTRDATMPGDQFRNIVPRGDRHLILSVGKIGIEVEHAAVARAAGGACQYNLCEW